jgi:hypothetical protein
MLEDAAVERDRRVHGRRVLLVDARAIVRSALASADRRSRTTGRELLVDVARESAKRPVVRATRSICCCVRSLAGSSAERPGERVERRVEIAGGVLEELGDLVQELDAARGSSQRRTCTSCDADELRVVAGLAVVRLEEVGDGELVGRLLAEALEGLEGLLRSEVALEHRAVPSMA